MNKEMLDNIKDKLKDIAEILYKGDVELGTAGMSLVIPDLATISSSIEDDATKNKLMNEALAPLLSAMEAKDGTLMADIISYELLEILAQL